ncbi:hypothetical protein HGRIS_009192 [Hohenbuehelia grisea]|uniref:AB hydrolase-1 domain-containing protein n=1 Tax=Hohenbuehelia grisea TaxID=104357 RepID=A0ABR3J0Q7_9AGAR
MASSTSLRPTKLTLTIAGLHVHVYHHPDLTARELPVVILFFLHGRTGSAIGMEDVAESIVMLSHSPSRAKDLYVVTFDQRNHGTRLVDAQANLVWKEEEGDGNERHAMDMYAIQTGTARDVSFLVDFLPSYLFPNDERTVSDWTVSGFSLGGHAAWIALAHDVRLKAGIMICGCPDYLPLITERARNSSVAAEAPYIPQSLRALIGRNDPASKPYSVSDDSNPFLNKKILVIAAGKDTVVTWAACESFVRELEVGSSGVKRVLVEDDAPHSCTDKMVRWTSDFVQEYILAGQL